MMRNSRPSAAAIVSVALFLSAPVQSANMAKPGSASTAGLPSVRLAPSTVNTRSQIPGLPSSAVAGAAARISGAAAGAPAGAAAVSARVEAMGLRLSAAAENAGDLGKGTGEQAAGLGEEAQKAITGEQPAPVSAEPAAPVPPAPAAPAKTLTQEQSRKIRALKAVAELFMDHYAPVDWKKLGRNVDLLKNYQDIRAQIEAKPEMTQTEFRRLLKGYVEALQDYHVGISFHATESSKLPFSVVGAEGRYFVVEVDREAAPDAALQPGDEITSWDGKPVGEVVKTLLPAVPNTAETDQRLAEMFLTARSARRAMDIPTGQAALKIRRPDGSEHEIKMDWIHRPEAIPQEIPAGGENLGPENADLSAVPLREGMPGRLASLKRLVREFMSPMMQVHPDYEFLAQQPTAENGFTIGARKSFVPELGKVVWPASEREKAAMARLPFHAYIYENEQGQKIGFIRIPDYMAGGNVQMAAQMFAQIIAKFEQTTDGLVIDQVNNPGGNMFYTYTLLSLLTDKPLKVPPHLVMLNQSHGRMAAEIIREAENPSMKKLLERAITEEIMGFTAVPSEENPVVKFARAILDRLKRAQDEKNPKLLLTDPLDLFGIKEIDPQPMVHYTKPIVVLVNELDFSGGDFFPAILKDNARATIFGVRTAGAGGAVMSQQWANRFGIEMITYTWTLAIRAIGQVLENLGVAPDEKYQLTADDLQNAMRGYKAAVNKVIHAKVVSAQLAGQAPVVWQPSAPTAAPRPSPLDGPMSPASGSEPGAAPTAGVDIGRPEAGPTAKPAPWTQKADEKPMSGWQALGGLALFFVGMGAFTVWILDPLVRAAMRLFF